MILHPRETVIFANDFKKMIDWYQRVLGFKIKTLYEEDYHYCNLENETGIRIGIADSQEMSIQTHDRKNNTVILQVQVSDVKIFLNYLQDREGKITFGPSFDKKGEFWYGGFEDVEGNPWWVVDENCPQ
jgi:uncharacterized glyoxalase superfamily protein PhnB